MFGYPLVVNSAVYRFAWVGCLGVSAVGFCGKRFHGWVSSLHNSIRDDRYLIGRRLHNFGEDRSKSYDDGGEGLDLVVRNDVGLRRRGNVGGENM